MRWAITNKGKGWLFVQNFSRFRSLSHVTGYNSYLANSLRIGIAFTLFFPIRIIYPSLSGECSSESGEQVYPVNNSPSLDTCELSGYEVWWGKDTSVNARHICIKFAGQESYLATCEQNRKSIQIHVNAIPIRWNFLRIDSDNHYPDTCKQDLNVGDYILIF